MNNVPEETEEDYGFVMDGDFPDPSIEEKVIGDRKYVKLGVVGVDSGQLMVCDPCYISEDSIKDILSYDTICATEHQLNYRLGHAGLGVVFPSGFGDGLYAVYGSSNKEGRIASVLIEMIDLDK